MNSPQSADVSFSPSQILERLQVLRQLQLLQRGKLQRQRIQFKDTDEENDTLVNIISELSSSPSYNTFHNMLQVNVEDSGESSHNSSNVSHIKKQDLMDGVSILNISQESEFVLTSPVSSNSALSQPINVIDKKSPMNIKSIQKLQTVTNIDKKSALPESSRANSLLEKEESNNVKELPQNNPKSKKPYLKRGVGLARFGLKKDDLVVQNTKSLPWRKKQNKFQNSKHTRNKNERSSNSAPNELNSKHSPILKTNQDYKVGESKKTIEIPKVNVPKSEHSNSKESDKLSEVENSKTKERLSRTNRGKTWAAILTQQQENFLRQLKQTEYYKNYASPAKSTISDDSCSYNLQNSREKAEQNMFELLESKVSNESFNLENSFFKRFLRSKLEVSGESTPLVLQRCLENNPNLLSIFPAPTHKSNEISNSDIESCNSEYIDCDDSSVSCCSCKTVEQTNTSDVNTALIGENDTDNKRSSKKIKDKQQEKDVANVNVTNVDDIKSNMAEMNLKLVATSELLKDRLRELEDEIETFRKENSNLAKMKEGIETERQKFYEEKMTFEQKFNEEKILSEYYLAEEKESLAKQKQLYERYVREMRGRLNKKEKDDVINLKKEINDLKEEIRLKDAKYTTSNARLRNQIKLLEKENKNLQQECEKLKTENKRIQHTNNTTRRLTNLKYLEEINRKLTSISSKQSKSDVDIDDDMKYKSYEIEIQNKSKKSPKLPFHRRAKSVPNLNVTSRYAKYFSQRDSNSQMENNTTINVEQENIFSDKRQGNSIDLTENDRYEYSHQSSDDDSLELNEGNLETIYKNTFQRASSPSCRASTNPYSSAHSDTVITRINNSDFFLRKSDTISNTSKSVNSGRSKSPIYSHSNSIEISSNNLNFSKSPVELSPERPNISKTNLNPTEIKRPDGTRELRFPNGNVKFISSDGQYSKFMYYNGDIKETFYDDGRIKYFYNEPKTYHTTFADGLEVLEFPDGQVEKRYKDGSTEVRLPNGSIRYTDPKNEHVQEEWRFPDGAVLTVSKSGEQMIKFPNGQLEVHAKDHKRREFPDGTVKLVYSDGTSETRFSTGRVRIKDRHGHIIMDSAPG